MPASVFSCRVSAFATINENGAIYCLIVRLTFDCRVIADNKQANTVDAAAIDCQFARRIRCTDVCTLGHVCAPA